MTLISADGSSLCSVLTAVSPPKPVPTTVKRFMPVSLVAGELAVFREGGWLSRRLAITAHGLRFAGLPVSVRGYSAG